MKKIWLAIFILILLVGCQSNKSGKLDTSKLNVFSAAYDKEGQVGSAIYEASSVKDILKTLPFKMKLPQKLPFDAKEYEPVRIHDLNNDGETLAVTFHTTSKNTNTILEDSDEVIILNIEAYFPTTITREPRNRLYRQEVELKNGVIGRLYATSIFFQVNNANFSISYLNTQISQEQNDQELIEMAKQMF